MIALSAMLIGGSVGAGADEKAKVDPTGTWKWSFMTQDGQTRETTLKLKFKDNKLTGNITGRDNREVEIKDGKVKGDEVSFQVTREFNGQEFTIKYKGKLEKDTIKGKTEIDINGEKRERDWEAKRQKDEKGK
ncbi:MAG TPA: hypothetical protein VKU02_28530 [Gemmataceae bacterium]|nr:hypothetical protein [Gemmataceae bacterium]